MLGQPIGLPLAGQALPLLEVHGFKALNFGAVVAEYDLEAAVTSLGKISNFGTPVLFNFHRVASMGKIIHFGSPYLADVPIEIEVEGFQPIYFGNIVIIRRTTGNLDREYSVDGFRPIHFGGPEMDGLLEVDVDSIGSITTFGSPALSWRDYLDADSLGNVITFGTPTMDGSLAVSGFKPIHFGMPKVERAIAVQGFHPITFGMPEIDPGPWVAYGWSAIRFGNPTLDTSRQLAVTSTGNVTHFGTPAITQAHRVTPMGVIAHFGTPLITRNPPC